MKTIELFIDVVYLIEIVLNFFKYSIAQHNLYLIATNYVQFYFVFDVLATIPGLWTAESFDYYWLKTFKFIHLYRLIWPLELLMGILL